MTLEVRKIEEISELGEFTLRLADECECSAAGMSGHEAVATSLKNSFEAYGVWKNGELLCAWGSAPTSFLGSGLRAWLLSTPAADKHKVLFARTSQRVVQSLLSLYPRIQVDVHADHALARKWLSWLGFFVIAEANGFLTLQKGGA